VVVAAGHRSWIALLKCAPLTTAMPLEAFPTIGFEEAPSYIPKEMIIPTFDDVPDGETDPTSDDFKVYGAGEYTKQILSFLKTNNMHMDFFINRDNWCGEVKDDQDCIATLTDILTTHNAANHTVHHGTGGLSRLVLPAGPQPPSAD